MTVGGAPLGETEKVTGTRVLGRRKKFCRVEDTRDQLRPALAPQKGDGGEEKGQGYGPREKGNWVSRRKGAQGHSLPRTNY